MMLLHATYQVFFKRIPTQSASKEGKPEKEFSKEYEESSCTEKSGNPHLRRKEDAET